MKVRPVEASDREAVVRLLSDVFPRSPRGRGWEILFEYGFVEDPPDYGFLVEDGGQVVAFFSVLYSDRLVRGEPVRVACPNSWCVREDYRGRGVGSKLADATLACLRERGIPIVALTLGPHAFRYMVGRGAIRFRAFQRVLFAAPPLRALLGAGPRLLDPATLTPEDVGEATHRIVRDHLGLRCDVRAFSAPEAPCVVITSRRVVEVPRPRWVKRLPSGPARPATALGAWTARFGDLLHGIVSSTEVMYVSRPDYFRRHRRAIAFRLALLDRTAGLSGDHRLLGLPCPSDDLALNDYLCWGLPEHLGPEDMDVLYSESMLLDLA